MANPEFHHDPHTPGRAYAASFLPEHTLGRGPNRPLSPINELKLDESSDDSQHIEGLGALPIVTLAQAVAAFGPINDNQNGFVPLPDRTPNSQVREKKKVDALVHTKKKKHSQPSRTLPFNKASDGLTGVAV